MRRIEEIITQTTEITSNQINSPNTFQMILRPISSRGINNFRERLENQINNQEINTLPSMTQIENIQVIDDETIITLNNSTTSERRIEFMQSIINYENVSDNSYYLIANSSNQVRTYLHNLLIRSSTNQLIFEEDLYRIGNILIYSIANLTPGSIELVDIIQYLRENMVRYNTNQIIELLRSNVPIYNEYLNNLRLVTEEQLQERTEEFNQEINERIRINRRRILYAGFGLVGSMALTSAGLPPVGGVIARTISNLSLNSSNNNSLNDIIRLRDIWDASLKKLLNIIEK